MNRAERRRRIKKRGDLNRLSTHKMRTNMGMKSVKKPVQEKVNVLPKGDILKLAKKETELAAPQGKTYFCSKCLKYHRKPDSAIYKAHVKYEDHNVPTEV